MDTVFMIIIVYGFVVSLPFVFIYFGSRKYNESNYKAASGKTFSNLLFEKGCMGEYKLYKVLERLEGNNKILTNLYVPRPNGQLTEIDMIMINKKGIFVFESKDYSGWIFGSEKQKMWTQVLNKRNKNKFLNPIIQNNIHIDALKNVLNFEPQYVFHSYVVFGERSVLKDVSVISEEVRVINRFKLKETLISDSNRFLSSLSDLEINVLHHKLQSYSMQSNMIKKAHIASLKSPVK